ncbi:MAG: hypothetical protein AAGF77_14765 [Bacteroidota bacterium]
MKTYKIKSLFCLFGFIAAAYYYHHTLQEAEMLSQEPVLNTAQLEPQKLPDLKETNKSEQNSTDNTLLP